MAIGAISEGRSPGMKLAFAILIAALLAIPLFTVYLLVYDRQSQSSEARASIAQGWGGPQTLAGPMLVIPYLDQANETVEEGGRQVTRTTTVTRELFIAPTTLELETSIRPERRRRSIYETVVFAARAQGSASFALPADLSRLGLTPERLQFDRAELRFGVSDARGLSTDNRILVNGVGVAPQPGNGLLATGGSGFFAFLDASPIRGAPLRARFSFAFRGHSHLALAPRAGQTEWRIRSAWPHPSFTGGFLPETSQVGDDGFAAAYRISNLALGTTLVATGDTPATGDTVYRPPSADGVAPASTAEARVGLIQPVDLYSQVNRSVKYGFLFIGFTFMAFLMFDVVAGVRVSPVEYLLVGAGLVLFFVMLLAFAEVVGFTPAYLIAGAAIVALLTAYSAAILGSRRRAGTIAGLLIALYAVLYVLLSLEAYSLLIGSLLLFAALASVMYLTRNLEWGARLSAEHES